MWGDSHWFTVTTDWTAINITGAFIYSSCSISYHHALPLISTEAPLYNTSTYLPSLIQNLSP